MQQGDQEFRSNNPLTESILGACIEVHRTLGPGLLESAYEECVCRELQLRGLHFRRQVQVGFDYKGAPVDWGYRIDILVEEQVIVELKSIERLEPVHQAQVLTYLKIGRYPIGLLINFNVPSLRQGIRRLTLRTPQV
jgi:GxxExxY protein